MLIVDEYVYAMLILIYKVSGVEEHGLCMMEFSMVKVWMKNAFTSYSFTLMQT